MADIDLRSFPPVEPVDAPERLSQTFLRHFDVCPRSAYLYLKYGGGAASHAMDRGSAFHAMAERYTNEIVESGDDEDDENVRDAERAKAILLEVLGEPDLVVPESERDDLRIMAQHFTDWFWIDPAHVVAVEEKFDLRIGDWLVTGKLDLATVNPESRVAQVDDYKTQKHIPSQDKFEGSFQTSLYALVLADGHLRDGLGVGEGVELFELRELYPFHWWDTEDSIAYRSTVVDRLRIMEFRSSLEVTVGKVSQALEDWNWPARHGDHCSTCPASQECPIPASVRGHDGEIRTDQDARDVLADHYLGKRHNGDDWKAIKAWAEANPEALPFRFGHDLILEWKPVEETKRRKSGAKGLEALRADIDRAVEYGEPFDWDKHFRNAISTKLTVRTLTPHELKAEKEAEDVSAE